MYTLQQLINFTPEQLRADPNLARTISNLYTGGSADVSQRLLVDPGFVEVVKQEMNKVGLPGFFLSKDEYQQAVRDTQAGRPVRASKAIEEAKAQYAKFGVDPNSVPVFSDISKGNEVETYGGKVVASNPPTSNNQTLANVTGQQGSTGSSGGQQGQVFRDQNDNFFVDGQPIDLKRFKELSINADFVPRNSSVSLSQAQTGKMDGSSSSSGNSSYFDPNKPPTGVSADVWNLLGPSEKALFAGLEQMKQTQILANQTQASVNAQMLSDALKLAQNDVGIKNAYGDAALLDASGLQRSLASINDDYAQNFGFLTQKQQEDRKAQQEQFAEAGIVNSGFAAQARRRLENEQSGVISSSKRELQNKLNQFGNTVEQKYGSASPLLASIQAGGMNYNPVGGVKGSVGDATTYGSQYQDILGKQKEIFNLQKLNA